MNKPNVVDMMLHSISLQIVACYKAVEQETTLTTIEAENDPLDDLVMAFRCVRRHISVGEDGKRFGSRAAFNALKDSIL